ncbi:hypothetical protein [Methylobacterium aerolatum]|uniref:Uncharacterized protein n=1 Tax=Methylobacterium aerolatum TaxID=418708 RepID=A0ABU0HV54_9HYPH|nr:hypothetical protein [Methylobacterium aerolatum]MDQ0446212.1 hypothetical protein [Methylobacterium aerolatum]GJD35555.1 hypothetical protein FMGBMHLM_2467 [Methylobacterium aerolatum]
MDRVRSEQPIAIDFEDLADLISYHANLSAQEAQTKLAEEEGRIAQYALVRRIASPENGRLKYHLDRIIKRADGDYIVDGWCAGGPHRPLALVVFNAFKDPSGFRASFNGREDVARMLKSDELNFGFSVPVKGAASIGLIALCSDGNIYQSDTISLIDDPRAPTPRPGLRTSLGRTLRRHLPV